MNAIGSENTLVTLNESVLTETINCVDSWYIVDVTSLIHGTRLPGAIIQLCFI
jgi:hypothetical protein